MGNRGKILVVDDDPRFRDQFGKWVTRLGYEVVLASDGIEAAEMLKTHQVAAVVTDTRMEHGDGWSLLNWMRWGGKWESPDDIPKTLIHSGDRFFWPEGGERLDLTTEVPKQFGKFAHFKMKGARSLEDIENFLKEVTV